MISNEIKQVREFFKAFKVPFNIEPTNIPEDRYKLRYDLAKEELDEYLTACKENNLKEIADALGDQLYVLYGSILEHGLQYKINEVFNEIQRSNMSKLDENGKPIFREDGKIMKSKLFKKPDFSTIL